MIVALLLWLSVPVFPSSNPVAWMRPESFRLTIGMSRADAAKALETMGVRQEKPRSKDQLVYDFSPTRTLVLDFERNRLRSIRFEMLVPLDQIDRVFDEERRFLQEALGEPRPINSERMLIYDGSLPNVMAVATRDEANGVATLVVRYYDPVVKKK